MAICLTPDGGTVAECLRCDARVTVADAEAAKGWRDAHWRVHDGEIGCGRRGLRSNDPRNKLMDRGP